MPQTPPGKSAEFPGRCRGPTRDRTSDVACCTEVHAPTYGSLTSVGVVASDAVVRARSAVDVIAAFEANTSPREPQFKPCRDKFSWGSSIVEQQRQRTDNAVNFS